MGSKLKQAQAAYDAALATLRERALDPVPDLDERTALEHAASEFALAERALEKARRG
jgi:outer membrane protein TolC